jgi:hypothetical protein
MVCTLNAIIIFAVSLYLMGAFSGAIWQRVFGRK